MQFSKARHTHLHKTLWLFSLLFLVITMVNLLMLPKFSALLDLSYKRYKYIFVNFVFNFIGIFLLYIGMCYIKAFSFKNIIYVDHICALILSPLSFLPPYTNLFFYFKDLCPMITTGHCRDSTMPSMAPL